MRREGARDLFHAGGGGDVMTRRRWSRNGSREGPRAEGEQGQACVRCLGGAGVPMWSPEREAEAPAGGDPAGLPLPEWEEDEERMSFLFSAFKRSREVNSTDWDSKMGFWAPLVLSHSRRQGVVRLRLRDLQEAFQRKGSVPLGLATVLQDLLR